MGTMRQAFGAKVKGKGVEGRTEGGRERERGKRGCTSMKEREGGERIN